ncbi:MAG: substrate-binding domain-containing protein [bacterium]
MTKKLFFIITIGLIIFTGCTQNKESSAADTVLQVLIPESAAPVLIAQVDSFKALRPELAPSLSFSVLQSEETIVQFTRNNARLIFTTRKLSSEEKHLVSDNPQDIDEVLVAYDAIAVITHGKIRTAQVSTDELQGILTGTITRWEQLEHANGTSGRIKVILQDSSDVAAYLKGRLLREKPLRNDFHRTNSSAMTALAVDATPQGIGFVALSWVDTINTNIRVLKLTEKEALTDTLYQVAELARGQYFLPHPANIFRKFYPLRQAVYLYARVERKIIVPSFSRYVTSKGQRYFLYKGLLPAAQPIRLGS